MSVNALVCNRMKKSISVVRIALLVVFCCLLFVLELLLGSVNIPFEDVLSILFSKTHMNNAWVTIVYDSRLPRALAASIAGVALSWSGLLMQTLFRNPLAGPSVLGISSGASLGVALLTLSVGSGYIGQMGIGGSAAMAMAAMAGAMAVLLIVMAVAKRLADNTTLLVFGIMLGYFTSAIISALQYKAASESLKSYVLWGMGSFSEASMYQSLFMLFAVLVGGGIMLFILKNLNLLLLGDEYAQSMGLNVNANRLLIITAVGIMAGSVTAFCGPIAFVGLVVPHIARSWMGTSEHVRLYTPVALIGIAVSLFSDLLSRILELPLAAVVSALGAPLIIYIILRGAASKSII